MGNNSSHTFPFDVKVINLKRRPDRLEEFYKRYPFNMINVEIVEGIDGKTLPHYENSNIQSGVLGCFLSHMKIWKSITKPTLVLEDDAFFIHNSLKLWNESYPYLPHDFDIALLGTGCSDNIKMVNKYISDCIDINHYWKRTLRINDGFEHTSVAYIISSNGALKLLNEVDKSGYWIAVDHFMSIMNNRMNNYIMRYPIVYSIWNYKTDIQ